MAKLCMSSVSGNCGDNNIVQIKVNNGRNRILNDTFVWFKLVLIEINEMFIQMTDHKNSQKF